MAKQTKKPDQPAPTQTQAQTQAVAPVNWGEMGVSGFEHVGAEDLGIPFLVILQKGSPQVDTSHPLYPSKGIEGAQAGDILHNISNSIVKKLKDPPLLFVPCGYQRAFVEWRPRDQSGGLVMVHKTPDVLAGTKRNEKNQDVLPSGNIIVQTAYFFGFALLEEPTRCLLGMTSTQLKKSRNWLNAMMNYKINLGQSKVVAPMFSRKWSISTAPESNAKGSWFGWKIEPAGEVTSQDMVDVFKDFAKKIAEGKANPALPPPPEDDNTPY